MLKQFHKPNVIFTWHLFVIFSSLCTSILRKKERENSNPQWRSSQSPDETTYILISCSSSIYLTKKLTNQALVSSPFFLHFSLQNGNCLKTRHKSTLLDFLSNIINFSSFIPFSLGVESLVFSLSSCRHHRLDLSCLFVLSNSHFLYINQYY